MTRSALCLLMGSVLCALKFSAKGWSLLFAMKYKGADEVKKLLGKHAIELHQDCEKVKWKYAHYVHQSGKLFDGSPFYNGCDKTLSNIYGYDIVVTSPNSVEYSRFLISPFWYSLAEYQTRLSSFSSCVFWLVASQDCCVTLVM